MSEEKQPNTAAIGITALLGLAGGGKALCVRGAVATGEIAAVGRVGSTVAREGALAGGATRAAVEGVEHAGSAARLGSAEHAGAAFAREGDDLARLGSSSSRRGALPGSAATAEREGALIAASEGGEQGGRFGEHALDLAPDLIDLGTNLIPDAEDEDDSETSGTNTRAPAAVATDAYSRLSSRPLFVSMRPVGAPGSASARFAALPGVRVATDADAAGVTIRRDRSRGLVIVYGSRAHGEQVALRTANGGAFTKVELLASCVIASRQCVMLTCDEASRCDDDAAWRAAGNVWGTTLSLAASEPDELTGARWLERVPTLRTEVTRSDGTSARLAVAVLRPSRAQRPRAP
jgi:hypothetical protein